MNVSTTADPRTLLFAGGTAGLVVAARLTQNPDVTVGVLEAGTSKLGDMLVDCPAMFLEQFGKPEYDWTFKSVPQVSHDIPFLIEKEGC